MMCRDRCAVVMAAALLTCAAPAGSLATSRTLVAWAPADFVAEGFQAMLPGFLAKHPDITVQVQLIPGGETGYMEKLAVANASGTPPDIAWVEGSEVKELAVKGQLEDVTRALAAVRFTPAETAEVTFRGRMWAAPYHTTARGLFKNVDPFEAAGMDPSVDPESMEELLLWSQKLTKRSADGKFERVGFLPWGSNWGAVGWIWTFGGRLVDETGIRPTANEQKNIEAFEWTRSWASRLGNTTPVTGGWTGFVNGSVSMIADSASAVSRILDKGVKFTTGRVPHPPGGRNGTWAGGDSIAIPSNAPHKDDAIRLLQYFSTAEAQTERYRKVPVVLPSNWDALREVSQKLPPQYGPLLAQLPEANPRTPLWLEYYVNQLIPAERVVISGQKTPQQVLSDVQTNMANRFAEVFGK